MPREYTYGAIVEAPKSHRDVARLAAMGVEPDVIATMVSLTLETVNHILDYPVVQQHLKALDTQRAIADYKRVEHIDGILDNGLKWAGDAVKSDETKDSLKLRILEFAADRHPNGKLVKQSRRKHEHSTDGLYDNSEIRKLKHAAAVQLASRGQIEEAQIVDADFVVVGNDVEQEIPDNMPE